MSRVKIKNLTSQNLSYIYFNTNTTLNLYTTLEVKKV